MEDRTAEALECFPEAEPELLTAECADVRNELVIDAAAHLVGGVQPELAEVAVREVVPDTGRPEVFIKERAGGPGRTGDSRRLVASQGSRMRLSRHATNLRASLFNTACPRMAWKEKQECD